jgi:hypothetical protein
MFGERCAAKETARTAALYPPLDWSDLNRTLIIVQQEFRLFASGHEAPQKRHAGCQLRTVVAEHGERAAILDLLEVRQ